MSAIRENALIRGSFVIGGGRLAAALVSAIWLIVAARHLSVSAFGDLAVLLAIQSIVSVIADLGYPLVLSAEVAAAGRINAGTVRVVIVQRLQVGLIAALLGSAAYLVVASGRQIPVVVCFSVSLLSTLVYSSLSAAMRGLHVFRFEAANELVSRSFVLVAGWVILTLGGGLVGAVAVYAVADFGSMVVLSAIARRHVVTGDDGIDHDRLRMRRNVHLSVGRGLMALYSKADTWLVALIDGSRGAALYGTPYRLLDGFLLVPRSIGAVAVPHFARQRSHQTSIRRVAMVSAALAGLFAIPVALFSEPILVALFGERYAPAASTLSLLAVSAIPGAVVLAVLPHLGLREPRVVMGLLAGTLAVNVVGNVVAITIFGPVGAAGVNLITQTLLAAAVLLLLRRQPHHGAQVMASIRSSATRAHSAVSSSTAI